MAELIIGAYARKGKLDADAELREMLELCMMEAGRAAAAHRGDAAEYLRETAAILQAIQAEGSA